MPRSLLTSQTKSSVIKLTDIDRLLTGNLKNRGLFNKSWNHLEKSQFLENTNHHNIDYINKISAPLCTAYHTISYFQNTQDYIKYKLDYHIDNLYMIPLITNIYKLEHKISKTKTEKSVKFGGIIIFWNKETDERIQCELTETFPKEASNFKKLEPQFNQLSIYTLLQKQFEVAIKNSKSIFKDIVHDLVTHIDNDKFTEKYITIAQDILYKLQLYKQNVNDYNTILIDAVKKYPEEKSIINTLSISNTNLMLLSALESFTSNKSNLQNPLDEKAFINKTKVPYTSEQLSYITSQSRNIVAMAGAGTGKSTALGGRVKYLTASNVNPNQILVLSFTNTAADNISQRYPGVNSMTIASVVNNIYSLYMNHTLSTPKTVYNSLLLHKTKHPFVNKELLCALKYLCPNYFQKPDFQSYNYKMLELMSNYSKEVIDELNAIGQTTFELQQSILYFILPMTNKLPKALKNIKYILVDEAQDTSLFELILLLRLSNIIDADINFIGDANQTLYEFRNAKAQSLNIIANHKYVSHYIFDINHRSNNYILTLANQMLDVLSTNEQTHMQLTSNNITPLNINEYQKHIRIVKNLQLRDNVKGGGTQQAASCLENFLNSSNDCLDYINKHYQKGEQIGFLSMSRNEVSIFNDYLTTHFGPDKVTILSPLSAPWSEALSKALIIFNDDNLWTKLPKNKHQAINFIISNLISILTANSKYGIPKWINKDLLQLQSILVKYNPNAFQSITNNYLERCEINHNNITQALKRRLSPDIDMKKPFIISTIHSAKGLEFPHVVLSYMENNKSYQQDTLRALGVGLTRAKNDEYIINSTFNNTSISTTTDSMLRSPILTAHLRAREYIKDQKIQ